MVTSPLTLVRSQYLFFIITVLATIVINQVVIQYGLSERHEHDMLIDAATHQRTLSQRITKRILYIRDAIEREDTTAMAGLDTLENLVLQFKSAHFSLLKRPDHSGIFPTIKSASVDSLLKTNTQPLMAIVTASQQLVANPSLVTARHAVKVVARHELPFLFTMDKVVSVYQREARERLHQIKEIEMVLAATSIAILLLEIFFIFGPMINRLRMSNILLGKMNAELSAANEELQANGEEVRSNLDHIKELQHNLEARENQYRELVENATDMIYELDEKGVFSYANPVTANITEYSNEELLQTLYWDIVHPDHRERVIRFYKAQRNKQTPFTYLELPILTRTGREVWVGQNVRMFFKEDWVYKVSVVSRDITILYRANEALQSSEQLFRTVAEKAPVGIYQLDALGRLIFVNNRWFEITGSDPQTLSREAHAASIHAEDRAWVLEAWDQAIKNKKEIRLEFRYQTLTKGTTWVINTLSPIKNTEGTGTGFKSPVTGFIGTMNDITALKEAAVALKASEQKFRTLAEKAPVGIFQTDINGGGVYLNSRWLETTGLTNQEAVGNGWTNAIHPEDRENVISEWMKAVTENREFIMEFRFVNPFTGIRWIDSHAIQLLDEHGKITGYIGTTSDITELKETQQKLIESEKLYRLISTNSRDLISLHNTVEGKLVRSYISPSVKDILGYEVYELIDRPALEIILQEDQEQMREVQSKILQGIPTTAEYRIRKKDGSIVWLESSAHPFFDEHGKMIGFQTSSRDVTTRKEFEEALRVAKEKAEEATLAKSQFLSMMSHEIRTPMNAVIGLTNLLLQDKPREDQQESLKLLKFSGENLLTIINDILDFSKIEAGKIVLEKIDVDLKALVLNIKQILEPRAEAKGIELRLNYDERSPVIVKGDQVRIGQTMTNLIGNAIKFTERGYVELSVTWQGIVDAKHDIHFSVKDTGVGIDPEKLQLIFESFSQATSDTTRKFGGTGLGLSITKRLLGLMGSTIAVTSKPDHGSTFSFNLLLPEGSTDTTTPDNVRDLTEDFKKRSIKILLVEDNPVNQVVAFKFLKKWGITVDLANHGKEAVEMIRNKSYQLVLMDLQMPEMDGFEASRTIRAMNHDPYFKTVPIIALTASAMIDIKDQVIEIGMNDFISKPFRPEELQAIIGKYVLAPEGPVPTSRRFQVSLEHYSEGDVEFKRDLAMLLIKNIKELHQSLLTALQTQDTGIFKRACHTGKTTLSMLEDAELDAVIERLKISIIKKSSGNTGLKSQVAQFEELVRKITRDLQEEINANG
jgi:PAS domain S-box-containing protein